MIHELKTVAPYFKQVLSGVKTFEVRRNDRNFKVGDYLWLREYDEATKIYTGRDLYCRVTYVLVDYYGLGDGYAAMAIKKTLYEL